MCCARSTDCTAFCAAGCCRYVYTKRCLGLTQGITEQLFRQPLALVQLLSLTLGWTTLLMVIVVSCLLGITLFVSLLRTYQHSAVLPSTRCGEPQHMHTMP
eukprot:GHRQ01018376.1.p2 GENE.GHRQ01018376.1~~GHRQ01018376.1.p2  ORF type:complete len:101 (-),score=24.52 GHRQ01018376.1:395-697(-)